MAIDAAPRSLVYTHPTPDLPGVHCLALNRPAARNALSVAMVRELADALESVAGNARLELAPLASQLDL